MKLAHGGTASTPRAPLLPSPDLEAVHAFVEERLGLSVSAMLSERVDDALDARLRRIGCPDLHAYGLRLLRPDLAAEEVRALGELLTVGETYFFREPAQIDAFVTAAVPERLRARGPGQPLRVLSAGCSSGEEPYTLAIALESALPGLAGRRVAIHGVDVSPAAIRRALSARYSPWVFRAAPPGVIERWFTPEGQRLALRAELRDLVTFAERNLFDAGPGPDLARPGELDVIFCRNVLIYLSRRKAQELVGRFARALAPGGLLFLGSSETLHRIPGELELVQAHGAFYYRRLPEAHTRRATPPPSPAITPSAAPCSAAPMPSAAPRPESRPPETPSAREVLALLERERFDAALSQIEAMPREAAADPEVQLLRATILAQRGDVAGAEAACIPVMEAGDRASAYYLLGLCREHGGHGARAAVSYRFAAEIDPAFALPHLRLGLLAKRANDAATARVELALAAELAPRERADRVTLFGGGFDRRALVELSRSELRSLGGDRA